MPDYYEYRVIQVRESMIGNKLSSDKLEKLLNEHGAQGWQLKAGGSRADRSAAACS